MNCYAVIHNYEKSITYKDEKGMIWMNIISGT